MCKKGSRSKNSVKKVMIWSCGLSCVVFVILVKSSSLLTNKNYSCKNGPNLTETHIATRVLGKHEKCVKSFGIHATIENLKSDERLSWMCLESDLGLFFWEHSDVGCLFG